MSFRLEIDGSISHVSDSDTSVYPHIELPLFTASVCSIHSNQESTSDHKRTASTKDSKKYSMTRKRYNHLCGNILVILFAQGAILLSVLVTLGCSFYRVRIEDDANGAVIFNVGLFRYSIDSESSSQQAQCTLYDARSTKKGSKMEILLNSAMSMLKVPQFLSIAAPVIATLLCICLVFHVLKPQQCCCRWYTGIVLLLATLFQTLVYICFQGQTMCENAQDLLLEGRVNTCEYSSDSRICIAASVFYGVTAIFAVLVPADSTIGSSNSNHREENDNQCAEKGAAGNEIEQNDSKEDETRNKSESEAEAEAEDLCIANHLSLQMEDDNSETSDGLNDLKDVERVGSFETATTEPTAFSPARETNTSSLYPSDQSEESVPVEDTDDGLDRPLDEEQKEGERDDRDRLFDEKHEETDLMLDNDTLIMGFEEQGKNASDSDSRSDSTHSTAHPDPLFDLM